VSGSPAWRTALWSILGVLAAAWLALVEVFWLPLRVGGFLVPVSVLAAVLGNLMLVGAVRRRTGSGGAAVLPAVTWLAVVVPAMIQRPEGDLIIIGGSGATGTVNLGFLLLGVVAASVAVGRALSGPRRPRSGSGSGGAR